MASAATPPKWAWGAQVHLSAATVCTPKGRLPVVASEFWGASLWGTAKGAQLHLLLDSTWLPGRAPCGVLTNRYQQGVKLGTLRNRGCESGAGLKSTLQADTPTGHSDKSGRQEGGLTHACTHTHTRVYAPTTLMQHHCRASH